MNETGIRWVEALAAGGGFIAFLKFIQWMVDKILNRRNHIDIMEGLEDLRNVYILMEKALGRGPEEHTEGAAECGRALLLSAHNSGGIPTPTAPFYVSAVHWAISEHKHRSAINAYNQIKVDGAYINMLTHLHKEGFYRFKLSENEGTLLRSYYESEGVTDSVLFFLDIRNNKFLYISFAAFHGTFTDKQITYLSICANEIRNLILKG